MTKEGADLTKGSVDMTNPGRQAASRPEHARQQQASRPENSRQQQASRSEQARQQHVSRSEPALPEHSLPEHARPSAGPVRPPERLMEPDLLRGIALFGILLVNMWAFSEPQLYISDKGLYEPGTLDFAVYSIVQFLFQGKFYTMFSFLFGIGLYWFMRKAERSHPRPNALALRRMFTLLAIGVIHAFLVWWGDILITYAITGVLLLMFWPCQMRTLVVWAFGLWAFLVVLTAALVLAANVSDPAQPGGFEAQAKQVLEADRQAAADSYRMYAGGFADVHARRVKDSLLMLSYQPFAVLFNVLPMALLGLAAAKGEWLQRFNSDRRLARRVSMGALAVGLPLVAIKEWTGWLADPAVTGAVDVWNTFASSFGDPALSFFYMAAAVLLFRHAAAGGRAASKDASEAGNRPESAGRPETAGWLSRALRAVANAGRASLSNYLLQSLVCTTVFYGYGFGMYGKWGAAGLAVFAILLYAAQVALSHWWFRRHAYGPVEWLLRSAVYLRRP